MITLQDYYMGRDVSYKKLLTNELRANATETVLRVNKLIAIAELDGVVFVKSGLVTSGWRPPAVNAATPTAAKKSNHIICKACDLSDSDGVIDGWSMANLNHLEDVGLWLEHPDFTPNWCHWQTIQPASGNRVFKPK